MLYGEEVEVIVIDDGSKGDLDAVKLGKLQLNLKVYKILDKNGYNPCVPYNVGVRHATGRTIVLSSPETLQIESMFHLYPQLRTLSDSEYLCYRVFCLTDKIRVHRLLSNTNDIELSSIRDELSSYTLPANDKRYPWKTNGGSWYSHEAFRKTNLNFLTAMTKSTYEDLNGFDERFRFGFGYDDLEFSQRVLRKVSKVTDVIGDIGIHLDHEVISNRENILQNPDSNIKMYRKSRIFRYTGRSDWGLTKCALKYESH